MSDIIDRDVKVRLASWAVWTRNIGKGQGYSSPAQMLINCAPFCDSEVKRYARYQQVEHISDEEALEVERAMATLKRYSARLDVALGHMLEHELDDDNLLICVLMYAVLVRHYRYDESFSRIARDLTKALGKKITDVRVKAIMERGAGFIEALLMS
ncbi:hypothetical protein [Psychrobacter sp. DAB_AL32B]|uniref:hypothetical protein n=1 Tax=Psychrobacter sp. DAB_AL32B TaxID=1028414 RepID=UPI000B7FC3CF|nr:hypothetical protein [Psychrobacter sp. DAB_AL32B]OXL25268.1 hypothetical protein CAN34_04515 [Psychrobacter sp. DAB_AL32B]